MFKNEHLKDRYKLAMERIHAMKEDHGIEGPYEEYFRSVADFIIQMEKLYQQLEQQEDNTMSLEELRQLNHNLYMDILPEHYETSYANPAYAASKLGEEFGKWLSFLYTEIRGMIVYVYEQREFEYVIYLELFLEIYCYFLEEKKNCLSSVKSAIYYFMKDYSDVFVETRTKEQYDPTLSFATDIIMNSNLTDERYLYQFGEYITDNERKIAAFLAGLKDEEIEKIARTYTEGFRKGFDVNNIDFSKKAIVNIRYCIGFERIVKAAILQFREMGLEPTIYRAAVNRMNKRQDLKIGYYSTSPNRQYDYDHRFDDGLYLDKAINKKKLVHLRKALETYRDQVSQFAGPAVIEVFGEKDFTPVNKKEAVALGQKQQQMILEYRRESGLLINEFLPGDQYSFTIIAFPIPDIGADFKGIFADTVKVNTLDMFMYEKIQQKIIDVLDTGEKVIIKGMNGNHTDMIVNLPELKNPEKETKFENCLADVNIPVGEVFTSPMLTGTNGTLHVTHVYLNDLEYNNLELVFKDGMIDSYTCTNFESGEENKQYVKENVLFNHETLPMGEFAIGTNTTAYAMGKKYNISKKLPILIAEKTGPHFAVGDTCYKMCEDMKTYNPDGKAIVARDNECSIKRLTNMEEAYYNCHTDITIPYNELGEISVIRSNGDIVPIIRKGRFVLPGTEQLNEALDGNH